MLNKKMKADPSGRRQSFPECEHIRCRGHPYLQVKPFLALLDIRNNATTLFITVNNKEYRGLVCRK